VACDCCSSIGLLRSAPCHLLGPPACSDEAHPVYDVLKANFDAAYEGNRAPFPIFVHKFWLTTDNNAKDLQRFAGGWAWQRVPFMRPWW
jgi:hypothetical protein